MRKVLVFLLAVVTFTACNNNPTADNKDTADSLKASGIAAILKADSAWSKASEAKSASDWLSYYADDAIMMPPNGNVCKDKASRDTSIKNMFATPGMSLAFQTTKADVCNSGELGYAVGVYQWRSKDPKGNDYHETGKYCETWKKQSDGSWKCIIDIWNADLPATK